MYCRNCGKEMADTDHFCKECGASADGSTKPNAPANKNIFLLIVYCVWAIFNYFLLKGDKWYKSTEIWYPFRKDADSEWFVEYYYDATEFIVYVFIMPALIITFYKLYVRYKKK